MFEQITKSDVLLQTMRLSAIFSSDKGQNGNNLLNL